MGVTVTVTRQSGQSSDSTLLVLQVASRFIALPAGSVREIVPMAALSRLPGQPAVLEGFLNLHGKAVPVMRIGRVLDLSESEPGLYTPLVVLETPSGEFALIADRAVEIASVPHGALMPVEEQASFNGCADAQVQVSGRTVAVLSPERLLLEKERRAVAEYKARMERRLAELEAGQE